MLSCFFVLSPYFDYEPLPSMYFVTFLVCGASHHHHKKTHLFLLFSLSSSPLMLGTAYPWLGQSLVVFDVVFLVVGLPSIVFAHLAFQDLVFGVLTSMFSFIARGRIHSLLISFRLPFPLYSRISLQLSSHLWWLSISPCLPLEGPIYVRSIR
ncbi:hypothetical protein HID58_017950 [Brassica napus]|uniref:Uncharacterized protein n=1 Tax=Brassica napus TaxID=3708 RepID=A0ABQ8D8I2_BRANA|nr:hypothetical protein HID58_017950 [Brassica napus]